MLRLQSKADFSITAEKKRTARIIPVFLVYRIFQLLTGTSKQKSVNTTKKNAFKLVKLPRLNVIC